MNLEKVLPPAVNGKIIGHLTVTVDEVFWIKSYPGEILVELLWWGEKEGTIFRPEDVTIRECKQSKQSSVTYSIRTSHGLFLTYLRNCGKLTFTVLRGQNKNVIVGSAVVNDIHEILSAENSHHAYYPIFNPKGLRLGDLHICIELKYKSRPSHHAQKGNDENKVGHPKDLRRRPASSKSSTAASHNEKKLLSDILNKGNDLRKAMMMSVLADCPIDKIDSVISDKKEEHTVSKKIKAKDEPKLVDFLLGKDMTADDEKKAIETLRCISPDDNLLKLAKTKNDSKVSQAACCLHGKNCHKKKNIDLRESASAPEVISVAPSSALPYPCDHHAKDSSNKMKVNEESAERRFNCYRLVVKTLDLTSDGVRKIYYAPVLSEIDDQPRRLQHPPGTIFMLEISVPSKGPWSRTLRFMTKNYKDKRVTFGQGTTHRLAGTVSWSRVRSQVAGSIFTVFWRHLNQRVPCPLGTARLDDLTVAPQDSERVSVSLPVYSNTRLLTGHLNIAVNLGKTSGGGEAMFRLEEPCLAPPHDEPEKVSSDNGDSIDAMTSVFSSKPPSRAPPVTSIKEIISVDSDSTDSDPKCEPKKLDDELLRTINLLNSKPDRRSETSRSAPLSNPIHVNLVPKSRQEACVQTTLPLTDGDCQKCHHFHSDSRVQSRSPPKSKYEDIRNNFPLPEKQDREASRYYGDHRQYDGEQPTIPFQQQYRSVPPNPPLTSTAPHGSSVPTEQYSVPLQAPSTLISSRFTSQHPHPSSTAPHISSVATAQSSIPRQAPSTLISSRCTSRQPPSLAPDSQRPNMMYDDYCHYEEKLYRDRNLREKLRVAPQEFNGTEKIHEFSVKIEKVVGVPVFTGDSDLDCYIDYSFPKVEPDGIMTLDRVNMGTEVRIALRETDFGTVSRHRLRLGCKLTRALLTLPVSDITFSLWGRYYRPTPRDYRVGKAFLPLVQLSGLEMKYEQQSNRQPVIENFVLPLEPVESFITRGYKGLFGELHISISYSSASGISYREWRCKNKNDHYWCQSHLCNTPDKKVQSEPNYECVRTQVDFPVDEVDPYHHLIPRFTGGDDVHPSKHFDKPYTQFVQNTNKECLKQYKGSANSEFSKDCYPSTFPSRNMNRCDFDPVSSVGKHLYGSNFDKNTNFQSDFIPTDRMMGIQSKDEPVHSLKRDVLDYVTKDCNRRMQPIGESIDHASSYLPPLTDKDREAIDSIIGSGKHENIVKKVLRDIEERKRREKQFAETVDKENHVDASDPFKSFNLGVELPQGNDTTDFEARSQYSFLKSPVSDSKIPVNNCVDLESSSSESIKQRLFRGEDTNPFLAQSNLSLNSIGSIFEEPENNGKSNHSALNEIPGNIALDLPRSHHSKISSRKEHSIRRPSPLIWKGNTDYENDGSSNGTLKSVESLKSYKDAGPLKSNTEQRADLDLRSENCEPKNKYFKARVDVCRALGLPSLEVKLPNGKIGQVKPTSHAYFSAIFDGKESILRTEAVVNSSSPVWNSSWDVMLPVELLKESERDLEIFVELTCGEESQTRLSDSWPVVLKSGVDLTPITAGLASASGWYSLLDRALLSRAQLKICVSPLEDISCHREEWLKDYTKAKRRRKEGQGPVQGGTALSVAASLQ